MFEPLITFFNLFTATGEAPENVTMITLQTTKLPFLFPDLEELFIFTDLSSTARHDRNNASCVLGSPLLCSLLIIEIVYHSLLTSLFHKRTHLVPLLHPSIFIFSACFLSSPVFINSFHHLHPLPPSPLSLSQ